MKQSLSLCMLGIMLCLGLLVSAQNNSINIESLPRTIDSGPQGPNHVQGIVVDADNGVVYFSFTTLLLKTDMQGRPLGSVKGLTGHLGCLTFDKEAGRIYGSLEYKNDAIGKGILKKVSKDGNLTNVQDAFYIAIFDVDKITRMDMDAEKDGVMQTVYLKEVVDDYNATVNNGDKEIKHRWGCSGIDGVTFAPAPGSKDKNKKYLHVAYGVYGEKDRTDNDYQVILSYDTRDWGKYEQPLKQANPHNAGPKKPMHKYFLYTGNTTYGVQNMAYDPFSGDWYIGVYRGKKPQFPNYSLFVADGARKSRKMLLTGSYTPQKGEVIFLKDAGLEDKESGVRGWNFPYGATGIAPLGNGYFYISQNYRTADKQQASKLQLYKWTGNADKPFEEVR